MRLLALKNTQLLPEKYDLDILLVLTSMAYPDEVEQQRERLRKKEEKHAGWYRTDHAERHLVQENGSGVER